MSLVSLQQTIIYGGVEEVKNLLDSGRLSANDIVCLKYNMSALSYAILEYQEKVTHLLLTRKANIHQRDRDGWAPLHYASRHGESTVVERLLELKADANTTTKSHISPLQLALYGNLKRDVVEMLILAGANPESIPDDFLRHLQQRNDLSWQSFESALKWLSSYSNDC